MSHSTSQEDIITANPVSQEDTVKQYTVGMYVNGKVEIIPSESGNYNNNNMQEEDDTIRMDNGLCTHL